MGQNLGAGRPLEARRAAWRVAGVAIAVMSLFAAIFLLFALPLVGGFTADSVVQGYAARYLQVVAISEPFLGIVMVLNGALQGAGVTRPSMYFTFFAQLCCRLPLAYVLAIGCGWGPDGAWWAMALSPMIQAFMVILYFQRARWDQNKV